MLARDACDGQPGSLPEVVMTALGDRGAEPLLELRLRGGDVLSFALQRPRLGEAELDGQDSDVTGGHGAIEAIRGYLAAMSRLCIVFAALAAALVVAGPAR